MLEIGANWGDARVSRLVAHGKSLLGTGAAAGPGLPPPQLPVRLVGHGPPEYHREVRVKVQDVVADGIQRGHGLADGLGRLPQHGKFAGIDIRDLQ